MTSTTIATTRLIAGSNNARSPCSARSAASIAYATDETGSAITAKANANSSTGRLCNTCGGIGDARGMHGGLSRAGSIRRRPDFPAHRARPYPAETIATTPSGEVAVVDGPHTHGE